MILLFPPIGRVVPFDMTGTRRVAENTCRSPIPSLWKEPQLKSDVRARRYAPPRLKGHTVRIATLATGFVLSLIGNWLQTGAAAENALHPEKTSQAYLNPLIQFEKAQGLLVPVEGPVEEVLPSKVIEVPIGREAEWLALGDLDNDGDLDFLTARNQNQALTALTAYNREGDILWRWGDGGGATITYDVPLQIYDIDGDGENEVLCSTQGHLVIANGVDGAEEKRWPLPKGLAVADCIIIANFRGKKTPSDILIKSRYDHVWAYDSSFSPLWEWSGNTGHHPCPGDIDGDGRDEVFCGYTLLDDNGREIWHLEPEPAAHADTARICWDLDGNSPDIPWYLTTCCGGNDLILTDHFGKRVWQMRPDVVLHFQSARAAELRPDIPGQEIVVDIAGEPGEPPDRLMLLDAKGNVLGNYLPDYTRFHDLVDWNGDGVAEIIIPRADGIFDTTGRQLVRFLDPPPHPTDRETPFCYVADMYNDGNDDVILLDDSSIRIYGNSTLRPRNPKPLVMKRYYNFTFY